MKNQDKTKLAVVSLLSAGAFLCDLLPGASFAAELAQSERTVLMAQASPAPQPAPSFLKQAGQLLLDSAQKKVIQQVNQKMQAQPAGTAAPGGQPVPQGAPAGGTATAPSSALRQAAPCRSWVDPYEKPIACLLCIHGLGLQSNSYEFFGTEASRRGLAVYAIDVRGFGSWMKAGGKTTVNFNECLADIKQALESIRAAHPGMPVYVLGESMGGAIALRAASMYPDLVDGLISSVPAGERFNQGKTSMKVFLNLLAGFDVSNVGGDVVNQATKNARLKAQWQGDPLARLNLTPQELIQFQNFMNNNHEAAKKVADMPVLFVQGNGDQLVKPEGTWELFNSVAAKDKSFFSVPGEHLIFEEAQTQDSGPRDQNFRVISSWLSTKVGHRNRGGRGMWRAGGGPGGPAGGMSPGRIGPGRIGPSRIGPGGFAGRRRYFNTQGLEVPAQMLESRQYAAAIAELERIRAQRPYDPNVLGLLGEAYYENGQPDKAGFYFRTAMRMGRGGEQSRAMNSYLMDINREAQATPPTAASGPSGIASMLAPFLGFGGSVSSDSRLLGTLGGGNAPSAKGKVYAFYANWAEQCRGMDAVLSQLASAYGNSVDIARVDVENPTSEALVEQFKVGPIPTVVFVSPGGQVSSTVIGESNYNNYEAAIRSIAQPYQRTY